MTAVTELVRHEGFDADRIDLIKRTICKGSSNDELTMFIETAKRLGLDPFARQVFAVKRWDGREKREVMAIQVSIDGFRLVAERTGKYAGQLGPFWTADGKEWVEVWLSKEPPAAAKVAVLRSDFKEPLWAVATWEQYKQEGREGLTPMWRRMGPLMLAKCAESLALRRAFPNELSGVYTQEEMAQATPAEPEYTPPERGAEGKALTTEAQNRASTAAPRSAEAATGAASKPPLPTADKVKHDGVAITEAQLKKLHIMRREAGGSYCTDENDERSLWRMKVLGVYRDAKGDRITSSKQLSKDQASHLIERLSRYIESTRARAEQVPDIGALVKPAAVDMTELAASMADKGVSEDDLCGFFGKDSITKLDREESADALALVIAWDTDRWELVRDAVRDKIEAKR